MPSSSRAIFIRALVFSSSPRAKFSFRLHQGPNFLRLSTCVFRFYYFFDSFLLSTQEKNRKTIILSKRLREVLIMLYYFSWYNKTQSDSFLFQLETTMQWLRKFKQKIMWDEKCLEKYWKGFLLLSRFKDVLAGTFSENK